MELSNQEKINLLNTWISNLDFHIESQNKQSFNNNASFVEGKPSKEEILNELINKKTFYEKTLNDLRNS
jgi:hypothetical protein